MIRYQNQYNVRGRTPGYYANNKLYPYANAPTETATRTSRRVHEGLSIDRNYGLDTTSDDLNSSPYSSPYYINGRYNSTNLTTQTGNSASVQGIERLLVVPGTEQIVETVSGSQTVMELWQGKQIRFQLPYTNKIVGITLNLKNTGNCKGILSIYLSATEDGPALAEMAIDLCTVNQDNFEYRKLYAMTPVSASANPRGKIYVRMEIWDEITCKRQTVPYNTGTYIEIAATGDGNHSECINAFGDKNKPVRDQYKFVRKPNRPELGLVYNSWEGVPTNRIEGVDYGATVSKNGYQYDIFCIKNSREAKIIIYDRQTQTIIPNNLSIDARVENLNLVQAAGNVYYVDGYSPLQKFAVGEWQNVPIKSENMPIVGASLITFHCNRIWLSGFRYDPNLVQYSEIVDSGPEYENFIWRFYVPDQSPEATSDNPVTAMVEYQPDRLMITNAKGYSLYATSADPATELPTQVSIHSDGAGVRSAGDITSYNGVIYSFDADEGIRRFTGSIWNTLPASLGSYYERVDLNKPRKLWGYAQKLYFNYTDSVDGKAKCLIWDMEMNYQQYPWFQDSDIPFCDVRADDDYDLIGIHPDFPCIMQLYHYDTWRRLDTPITFRRDAKYLSLPGNAAELVLKRVFIKVLANTNRWWWVGLSFDKNNLNPDRGVQAWYRLPVWATKVQQPSTLEPFSQEDIYEQYATSQLALPNLNAQVLSVQVRVMAKTFRAQANYVSLQLQGTPRPYN